MTDSITDTVTTVPANQMNFFQQLESRCDAIDSLLCIGLDPHPQDVMTFATKVKNTNAATTNTSTMGTTNSKATDNPAEMALQFCLALVEATLPFAACYKPNAAFFEALGEAGHLALKNLVAAIRNRGVPVLLDVKRGDIGSTATAYAKAAYGDLGADAVTLSPLMGWDSVAPFVTDAFEKKGAFLLCKTSNPGSNDLLTLQLAQTQSTLYEHIAKLVGHEWNAKAGHGAISKTSSLGLVVGATDAIALQKSRQAAGDRVWILAPGVGAQGGDLIAACKAGLNSEGKGLLIPVSRGVARADDPAAAAEELRDNIRQAVKEVQEAWLTPTATDGVHTLQAYQQHFIEFALELGVLKFGSFILKSGRTSPYFFNAGLFSTGKSLHQLGHAYASAIMASPDLTTTDPTTGNKVVNFDVLFGPAYKGISLGAVVSSALYAQYGVSVGFSYNRKEAKDHGEGGVLVGADMVDKRVLVVDDVITAGTAIRESHTLLMSIKANVVGVIIALDRAEKRSLDDPVSAVQAVARDLQLPVVSIVSLPQLQTFLKSSPNYGPDVLQSVSEYRSQYGVSSN